MTTKDVDATVAPVNDDERKTDGKGAMGSLVQAEGMLQVAITLPAAVFIGWAVGSWLDKKFGTSWIMIVGVLFGAVAGSTQIILMMTRMSKRGDR